MSQDVFILGAARTAIGAFQGAFSQTKATELGAAAIKAAVSRAAISNEAIDEIIMGCVLPAGLGQAPARQAAIAAGLPLKTGATTVNKMCGSGMKAIMQGEDSIRSLRNQVCVVGGLESMTQSPYLLPKARGGMRLGHGEVLDHMFLDGLQDAAEGHLMGVFAERTAEKYGFSREQQDEFAIASLKKAQDAQSKGLFSDEITPVTVLKNKEPVEIIDDETPKQAKIEKIPSLKPAFKKDGTVTAANSSSISDGGAALVIANGEWVKAQNLSPLAKIVASTTYSQEPAWFTTAPVSAIKLLLEKTNLTVSDIDLFEINEAFAVVTMAAIHDLDLPPEKVNCHGGACALGHPIGASGARIVTTLIYALKQKGLKRGIASLCIGGGEATAMLIELM